MRKTPTFKQKLFAQEYVASRGNGTKSALKVYDTKNYMVAESIGSENLSKPIVQNEIRRILEERGLPIELLIDIHKRNLTQSKQLAVSQSAVDTGYKLYGYLNNDNPEKSATKIAIIISEK
jgi:phage terminase small subunit